MGPGYGPLMLTKPPAMKRTICIVALTLPLSIPGIAQTQLSKQLQLVGSTAADRHITGLAAASSSTDAVDVASLQNSALSYASATNAGSAYSVSLAVAPVAYSAGLMLTFKASAANSGATTLNVNGLGPKNVFKYATQALAANDIASGQTVTVMYDGSAFQVLSELNPASGFTGSLSGDVTGTQTATTIAPNAVNSGKIANGTIVDADINTAAAIAPSKLSTAGAISGQVVTYNGTNAVWGSVGGTSVSFNRVVQVATAGNTSYAAVASDGIIGIDMSAGTNFALTLPPNIASGNIIVVKIEKFPTSGFPTLTIVPAGVAKTIDGNANVAFGNAGGNRRFYSDGNGNWYAW